MADETTLNHIMADENGAADARLSAAWPSEFYETVRATMARAALVSQATSPTSLTIALGPHVVTLDDARAYEIGVPVKLTSRADTDNAMSGVVTVAEVAKTFTFVADQIFGAPGPFADWNIIVAQAVSLPPSAPATEGQGGTGANTFTGARANMDLIRRFKVFEARTSQPSDPPSDRDFLISGVASGAAWAGHDNELALWDFSGSSWSFVTAANSDQVVTTGVDAGDHWTLIPAAGWEKLGHSVPLVSIDEATIPLTILVGSWTNKGTAASELLIIPDFATTDTFLTIPSSVDMDSNPPARLLTVKNRSANQFKINVTGGELIDGSASVTVAAGVTVRLLAIDGSIFGRKWTQIQ